MWGCGGCSILLGVCFRDPLTPKSVLRLLTGILLGKGGDLGSVPGSPIWGIGEQHTTLYIKFHTTVATFCGAPEEREQGLPGGGGAMNMALEVGFHEVWQEGCGKNILKGNVGKSL